MIIDQITNFLRFSVVSKSSDITRNNAFSDVSQ